MDPTGNKTAEDIRQELKELKKDTIVTYTRKLFDKMKSGDAYSSAKHGMISAGLKEVEVGYEALDPLGKRTASQMGKVCDWLKLNSSHYPELLSSLNGVQIRKAVGGENKFNLEVARDKGSSNSSWENKTRDLFDKLVKLSAISDRHSHVSKGRIVVEDSPILGEVQADLDKRQLPTRVSR